MDQLFSQLTLADVHSDVIRNIVSLRESQDLFDDLTNDPDEWKLAQQVEDDVKPPPYQSRTPVIHRPFEDAEWFNVIAWPFNNWQKSRFSDGTFGVWYGSDSVITTVYESAYHWYQGLLRDAGFDKEHVIGERKVYSINCNAAMIDFRRIVQNYPDLVHKTDYTYTQSIGARIHREGHPGLIMPSVRYRPGENYVVFNPEVLANHRMSCQLTYQLVNTKIIVEKTPGTTWLELPIQEF